MCYFLVRAELNVLAINDNRNLSIDHNYLCMIDIMSKYCILTLICGKLHLEKSVGVYQESEWWF